MQGQNRQTEQIERYLRGELNDAERSSFESALVRDAGLRREVALHRELEETFGDPGFMQFSTALKGVVTPSESADMRVRRMPRWWVGLAATLLLAAVAAFLLLRKMPASSPEALFAQYFTPYPADAFRSGNDDPAVQAPAAIAAYQSGRYADAVLLFDQLPADSLTAAMQFYRAEALLADGQGAEAARLLEDMLQSNDLPGLIQPLQWYLALAWLQSGDSVAALTRLNAIAADAGHYKQNAARELIAQIPLK